MADIKISQLPFTSSVSGIEIIPLDQGNVTKKILYSVLKNDILSAVPTIPTTIYTGSGTLFDTGVATTRRFSFITDSAPLYNPSGQIGQLLFNKNISVIGAITNKVGDLSFMGTTSANFNSIILNISPQTNKFSLSSNNGLQLRLLTLDSDTINLYSDAATGYTQLSVDNTGIKITDTRTTKLGLTYAANYSANIMANIRSIPDVETVTLLRQDLNVWEDLTRPVGVVGRHGFNLDRTAIEVWNGANWVTQDGIYSRSGEVFDSAIATTRRFKFAVSSNSGYNPLHYFGEMMFGHNVNILDGTTSPMVGGFGMLFGQNADARRTILNYASDTKLLKISAYDGTTIKGLTLDSTLVTFGSGTATGSVQLEASSGGLNITDLRTITNKKGLTYAADYSSDIILNNRSIPDVGTVKQLSNSIYTTSGNVFDTGVATTRRFGFLTDLNAGYNPGGHFFRMNYGSLADTASGALTDTPGAFNLIGKTFSSSEAFVANYTPTTRNFQFSGYNGTQYNTLDINPYKITIAADANGGQVSLIFDDNGATVKDTRGVGFIKGLEYDNDYNSIIINNLRSIVDVRGVQMLRQQANTWTTAGRPLAATGVHGFNTTTSKFEGYNGTAWVDFA
jgi:hypothetical protein